MTTIQSIQWNIHYTKKQLNRARKAQPIDELQKLNKSETINALLLELKELKNNLQLAIKQISK